jgi:hypothetical protein
LCVSVTLGSLVYIFKLTNDLYYFGNHCLVKTLDRKESVMKDLGRELKATYDVIAENTSMSDELVAEREKIVTLMSDLGAPKGDVNF